jgi:hypothetical protein
MQQYGTFFTKQKPWTMKNVFGLFSSTPKKVNIPKEETKELVPEVASMRMR